MDARSRPSLLVVTGVLLVVGGFAALLVRAFSPGEASSPASTAASAPRAEPEGRGMQQGGENEGVLPRAPAESSDAGAPTTVARRFAANWINQSPGPVAARVQVAELVALSTGSWAREVHAALQERAAGGDGSGNEGAVIGAQPLASPHASRQILVTTRERVTVNGRPVEPYHYGLYLARLDRAGDGFAVSSWEPQF